MGPQRGGQLHPSGGGNRCLVLPGKEFLISGCRLLIEEKGQPATRSIVVREGRIERIIKQHEEGEFSALERVDAKGLTALPGLVDAHVHFREPGYCHKEDWLTGSRAAASGGATTVLEMPNTRPATLTRQDLERKRVLAAKSVVDYGFHLGASLARPMELNDSATLSGVAGVKFYFDQSNGDPWIPAFGSGRMRVIGMLRAVARSAGIAVLHAKGSSLSSGLELARHASCPALVAHTPGREELAHIARARSFARAAVHCEVTPHHLFLSQREARRLGEFAEADPPLGTPADRQVLWHALNNGIVDTIASDHSPHTAAEKALGGHAGFAGLETMLPLLLDARYRGLISLGDIQRLCCENPARIFHLERKGRIAPGYDADIVLADLRRMARVENCALKTKCGWSPFHGRRLRGWPAMTFVRGQLVFSDGEILAPERGGTGREVRYADRQAAQPEN